MKGGQIVKVYQNPIAEQEFEGEARLQERYAKDVSFCHDGHEYEAWWVKFIEDEETDGVGCTAYHRVIRVQEPTEKGETQ